MFRRATLVLALIALAACQDEPVTPTSPEYESIDATADILARGDIFVLTLLHNNDGESALLPDGEIGGVARFASLVEKLRWGGERCLSFFRNPLRKCDAILVSSGDNFLAGPQFNASLELPAGTPFYDAVALDRLRYDAVAIGNHEFDFGPDVLADFIGGFEESAPPFLSANLDVSGEPELAALEASGRIARSVIVETSGGPVGIIGATSPRLATISSPRSVQVDQAVALRINAEAEALEASGVDRIILISHLQSLEEDKALIGLLRGVDIVVAGGGDELLASRRSRLLPGDEAVDDYPVIVRDAAGHRVPVVTTAGSYRYVGRLEVVFFKGRVIWFDRNSGPVAVVGRGTDAQIEADVEAPVAASVADLASNVIGSTGVGLDGVRANIRTRETNLGNLIADAHLAVARDLGPSFGIASVDVALQNGGGIRNDDVLPAGPITELNTFEVLPFSNVLSVVEGVSRDRFREILENVVSRVEFTDGRFAQIAGFTLEYDAAATAQVIDVPTGAITTAGERVRSVTLSGGEAIVVDGIVQPGAPINIATINFLAAGGDQYPMADLASTNLGFTYQQVLETFVEDASFLGGTVSATDYPAGGEGRIIRRN